MIRRFLAVALALALGAVIVGLKWETISRYGSDLPQWDQWDAEGLHVFVPWFEGRLGVSDFLRAHNEHRIVLTKLLGFAELLLVGQWDGRVQCAVNALLHAGVGLLLFSFARRAVTVCWHAPLFLLIAALTGLPLAWQNVISGFHSQQYFLLLTSAAAILLLPGAAFGTRRWWTGAVAALLALGSMGSGVIAPAMVIGITLIRNFIHPAAAWRSSGPTLIWCSLLLALGIIARVEVSYHDHLKARSLAEFLLFVVHSLQWPSLDRPILAGLFWAPFMAVLLMVARDAAQRRLDERGLAIVGLAGWTLLQILASAYARGADGGLPAPRYMDTLAFGVLANAIGLAWVIDRTEMPWLRRVGIVCAGLWTAAVGHGAFTHLRNFYASDLPLTLDYTTRCEATVRAYTATGKVGLLSEGEVPYPGVNSFRERIDIPSLRAVLPSSVRRPLRLESASIDSRLRREEYQPGQPYRAARWVSVDETGGKWRSLPLVLPRGGYLAMQVQSSTGAASTELTFRDTLKHTVLARLSAADWNTSADGFSSLALPAGTMILEVTVAEGDSLAFTEPVEISRLSRAAEHLVAHGRGIWVTGLACAAIAGLGLIYTRSRE